MALHAEKGVAVAITGRDQGVVDAARGILGQCQDRTPLVGTQDIAGPGHQMQAVRAGVLVGHELAEIGAVEGPGIDHLLAMGVDDRDGLARRDERGLATTCRNFDCMLGHDDALQRLKAIMSISTIPPLANAVTPTVVRAGRLPSAKWGEKISFIGA